MAPIQPFMRPRQPRTAMRGDCYRYASNELLRWTSAGEPGPTMRMVHGTILWSASDRRIEHAWIERGGYAYDWQTFALARRPVWLVADFYEQKGAQAERRYTAKQAAAKAFSTGHHGPWHASAAKYEGWGMTPEAIAHVLAFDRAELRREALRAKGSK